MEFLTRLIQWFQSVIPNLLNMNTKQPQEQLGSKAQTTVNDIKPANEQENTPSIIPPQGRSNVVLLDVGHGGRVLKADNTELSEEEYNALTLKELKNGIANNTLKIDTTTYDIGATSPINASTEYVGNLYQALAIADKLRADGWDIKLFASGDDPLSKNLSPEEEKNLFRSALNARWERANKENAEIFISVHNNYGVSSGSEIFYAENNSAGKDLANRIGNALQENGRAVNRIEDETKTDVQKLRVLRQHQHDNEGHTNPDRALILLEGVYMTDKQDVSKMTDPAFLEQYSKSVAEGVKSYALNKGFTKQTGQTVSNNEIVAPSQTPTLERIQQQLLAQ